MMDKEKVASSPSQLKEKIANLRKELEKTQQGVANKVKHKADEHEEGLTHIEEVRFNPLTVIEDLESEIDLLLKDNTRLREEKLSVLAEGENLKKRLHDELTHIKKYRAAGIAEKLLPALDNFERALQVQNVSPEVKNFLTGFEMIYKLIKLSFGEEGISEIDVKVGDSFDSNLHSAIEIVETKTVKSGRITKILQKGYKLHDRVLRHASVEVEK